MLALRSVGFDDLQVLVRDAQDFPGSAALPAADTR
jgi:hypothetical protein